MRLNYLSATDALAKLQAGQITSEALVRDCLRRIEEREPDVRAWAAIDRDGALSAARNADKVRRNAAGEMRLLLGIPVGVKDTISTADLPTVYNSPIYRDHRPGSDAAIVDLLRSAGAIVLGKTETVEFAAHGRPAPTRNPCDPTRTPSGSSSGSAAAVADFMVPLAIGSQTGGSLIRPGSYCGCVGFKPTYGTVSTEGVKPFSVSLDTVGWYGRSVEDIALVARAFEIVEGALPRQRRLAAMRFGLCQTPYLIAPSPQCAVRSSRWDGGSPLQVQPSRTLNSALSLRRSPICRRPSCVEKGTSHFSTCFALIQIMSRRASIGESSGSRTANLWPRKTRQQRCVRPSTAWRNATTPS